MVKILILNDVFTDSINNGIFTYLNALDVPWKSQNINKQLNFVYHKNHSGNKETSPFVDSLLVENSLTENDKTLIAISIFSIFSNKWNRLYKVLSVEYEPIENYNMEESEKTDNTTEQNNDVSNFNSLYGFNSISAVNSDKQDGNESRNGSMNETRTLIRHGNIGVTTSQQMLESEIQLWEWNFFETVFKDIDTMLTIQTY